MSRTTDKDFGTPKVISDKHVTLRIDGKSITVPEGTSVMRAAAELDINIPSLCATDRVKAFGSCRLCLVEINGRKGMPASCHTLVEDGMDVSTQTDKVNKLRKHIMELYISDLPFNAVTCSDNGDSELYNVAKDLEITKSRYGSDGQNHLNAEKDESTPYFTFDPSQCIVCSRCVRACEDVQGTFALTVSGRGFDSKITASDNKSFMDSECVSCGECVDVCPTGALMEKTTLEQGIGNREIETTCAYCGVGCSLKAELKGDNVVRMSPNKDGGANEGHACVKGRFAWGYGTHPDRVTSPMVRKSTNDEWKEVSWEEALTHTASEFRRLQSEYGKKSIGAITSSRCTLEENFLMQKLVRAVFGNNNIDNCARVCHAPTGYGLNATLGTSAGTQHFASVDHADVILVIGANPPEAHPVFGSRLKKRVREGAKLIVIDPRKTSLVKSPHVEADYHLQLRPGTNIPMINAIAHVLVTENLIKDDYIKEQCDLTTFNEWKSFIKDSKNSPEEMEKITGVPADDIREAARLYGSAPNAALYYGLGVSEHSQGSTAIMGLANIVMATGNLGRLGVGISPLRGQNNVQGACDVGGFPHQFPGYRLVTDDNVRAEFEKEWAVDLSGEPGYKIPNMIDEACAGNFKGLIVQGEDIAQSDPDTTHIIDGLRNMECVVVNDIFMNETAKYAHVILPGATFMEKDGTFINAERRINRIRKLIDPIGDKAEWLMTAELAKAMGYEMYYNHPSEVMDEIARTTPAFTGVSYDKIDRLGSIQWPCNDKAPEGTKIMHVGNIIKNPGTFMLTEYTPTPEQVSDEYPLILTTGRALEQYNVGAQTRRTKNSEFLEKDWLEIHPLDAEERGIRDGDMVSISSRMGNTTLYTKISERMQAGVVFTTFHFAESGTNVLTTNLSDNYTECPEYKVTAVDVRPTNKLSDFQEEMLKEASKK